MKTKTIKDVKLIDFKQLNDSRGKLVIVGDKLPFPVKRVFYSYDPAADAIRANHANKNADFILIAITGSFVVDVTDITGDRAIFKLDKPHVALHLPAMTWKKIYDFSQDSVFLAMSNMTQLEDEIIYDYNEFLDFEFADKKKG